MLLSTVIIILREVLEAALLVSVLLALTKQLKLPSGWIFWSAGLGMFGTFIYADNIFSISDWFDGVGQEVINAFLQYAIFIFLLVLMFLLSKLRNKAELNINFITTTMCIIVLSAITREGSEILIYLQNFATTMDHLSAVIAGTVIGAGIGCSIGIMCYFFLCNFVHGWSVNIGLVFLVLIGSGMVSQATLSLIQADWLPSQAPLWNSGNIVSESSVVGQLLYAVIGYESTPTAVQVGFYVVGMTLLIVAILPVHKSYSAKK
ncbi:MAG: FTR1 family protein [Gammaproteobacteria bacterium]